MTHRSARSGLRCTTCGRRLGWVMWWLRRWWLGRSYCSTCWATLTRGRGNV